MKSGSSGPDPVWTQSVLAVVVPEEGATVTVEDIVEHCRLHIASYKKPRHVEFLDALPAPWKAPSTTTPSMRSSAGGIPGQVGRERAF